MQQVFIIAADFNGCESPLQDENRSIAARPAEKTQMILLAWNYFKKKKKKNRGGKQRAGLFNHFRGGGGVMVANLGGGGDELGDLVQAVQVRNQLQPQVDLRTAEQRSHKVTGSHNRTFFFNEGGPSATISLRCFVCILHW